MCTEVIKVQVVVDSWRWWWRRVSHDSHKAIDNRAARVAFPQAQRESLPLVVVYVYSSFLISEGPALRRRKTQMGKNNGSLALCRELPLWKTLCRGVYTPSAICWFVGDWLCCCCTPTASLSLSATSSQMSTAIRIYIFARIYSLFYLFSLILSTRRHSIWSSSLSLLLLGRATLPNRFSR